MVDGSPYLVLGAQVGNSAAWPAVLPDVWPALEAMHVNTAEMPVYWEQIEPRPGEFDWTNVDALLAGAREHHLHLILLWFGTWKNGNDHYVPTWVKEDPQHFLRMINSAGTPLDDLSANAPANMEADRKAFSALMHHLAERDAKDHTVLMMQVENESGGIGAIRDYSPASNKEFAAAVPDELVKGLGKKPGTWTEVFPGNADEAFQAWHQAKYMNAVATAGKHEFQIPFYCNVWLAYPPGELPERHIPVAGIAYPSGGPNQGMLAIWKVAAPSIDLIGPDLYSSNPEFLLQSMNTYTRPDNPLWIPEIGQGDEYAPFLFAALDHGALGFSPFGIDWTDHARRGYVPPAHAENFALLGPMDRTIALLNFQGKTRGFVEAAGTVDQETLFTPISNTKSDALKNEGKEALIKTGELANAMVPFNEAGTAATRAADANGDWVAEVRFGFPQHDGQNAPGNADKSGRILVAQTGDNEFLLTGLGGAVFFHRPGFLPGIRMQILKAEQGYYTPAPTPGAPEVWHTLRNLNGDETDRGIAFPDPEEKGSKEDRERASAIAAAEPNTPNRQRMAVRVTLGRF